MAARTPPTNRAPDLSRLRRLGHRLYWLVILAALLVWLVYGTR